MRALRDILSLVEWGVKGKGEIRDPAHTAAEAQFQRATDGLAQRSVIIVLQGYRK